MVKITVFWDVASCSLADTDRCFKGTYCLNHHDDEAVRSSETSVNFYETTRHNIPEDITHAAVRT
jgi:hypothetical protein